MLNLQILRWWYDPIVLLTFDLVLGQFARQYFGHTVKLEHPQRLSGGCLCRILAFGADLAQRIKKTIKVKTPHYFHSPQTLGESVFE